MMDHQYFSQPESLSPEVQVIGNSFRFNHEMTINLIKTRIKLDSEFRDKKTRGIENWTKVVEEMNLQGLAEPSTVKKKWENLVQKYKTWKKPATGIGAKEAQRAKPPVDIIELMDEFYKGNMAENPPFVVDSANPDFVELNSSSGEIYFPDSETESDSSVLLNKIATNSYDSMKIRRPRKRRCNEKETHIMNYLEKQEEKTERLITNSEKIAEALVELLKVFKAKVMTENNEFL